MTILSSIIDRRPRPFDATGLPALTAIIILAIVSLNCTLDDKFQATSTASISVTYAHPMPRSVDVATNTAIMVTFTEDVSSGTVNSSTFRIPGVNATVTYDSRNRTAILRPTATLAVNTTYTVEVTSGILGENQGQTPLTPLRFNFTTGALTDTTGPASTANAPMTGTGNMPISSAVAKTFTEPIDPFSISDSSFALSGVPGRTRCIGATVVFLPSSPLAVNTTYSASATTGIRGLAGETVLAADSFALTTGFGVDSTRPRVEATVPAPDSLVAVQAVTVRFSEEMNPLTVTTATFSIAGVPGLVHCAGREATFYPITPLTASTTYTVTVRSTVKDLSGNSLLEDSTFTFTTPASADVDAPTVALFSPRSGEAGVRINRGVHILFSEPMDPMTINAATIRIAGETGLVTYDAATRVASFLPVGNLRANTTETLTIARSVRDLSGNPLATVVTCTFATGALTESSVPNLASAGGYAVLGGSAVSATGAATRLHGDLGVHPGTTVTGFFGTSANEGPGVVNGRIYQGVFLAEQAQGHATAAYNDIAGRSMDTAITGVALDGQNLTPGVYRDTGNAVLGGGVLTLDAQGRADALFLFRVSGQLSVGAGARVVLLNGARADRVFWQVGGTATIGASASAVGTILANTAVNLGVGAHLRGRAMALTGAVSLADSGMITRP